MRQCAGPAPDVMRPAKLTSHGPAVLHSMQHTTARTGRKAACTNHARAPVPPNAAKRDQTRLDAPRRDLPRSGRCQACHPRDFGGQGRRSRAAAVTRGFGCCPSRYASAERDSCRPSTKTTPKDATRGHWASLPQPLMNGTSVTAEQPGYGRKTQPEGRYKGRDKAARRGRGWQNEQSGKGPLRKKSLPRTGSAVCLERIRGGGRRSARGMPALRASPPPAPRRYTSALPRDAGAAGPAFRHFMTWAMLRPRLVMVRRPSSSPFTSPGARPNPMFQ